MTQVAWTVKPKAVRGPYLYSDANARRVLTGAKQSECLPTHDPYDRAHVQRDAFGLLTPSAHRSGEHDCLSRGVVSKPRLYHASQMVTCVDAEGVASRIGVDSSFDGWAEAHKNLSREGITLGAQPMRQAEAAAWLDNRLNGNIRLRDMLEPRTRQRQSAGEKALEDQASDLLRSHFANESGNR